MRKKLSRIPRWDFAYAKRSLGVVENIELEGEYRVMILPMEDLQSSVLATLEAKFGDLEIEGSFTADGKIDARFEADVEEAE